MPHRKCWSKTVGAERGTRVRVYEREPGGVIQIAVWIEGDGESRRSLGHRNRAKAEQQARNVMRLREDGTSSPAPTREPATLGELFEEYMAHATHTRQGCLKTEPHRRDMAWRAVVLLRWFGHDCSVDSISRNRLVAYIRARRAGLVGDTVVRTRSVQIDLTFFKAALSWACGSTDHGVPLVSKNVLAGFPIPDEPDPRRPLLTDEAVNALLAVAAGVHPLLPQLIVIVGSTGRRLGSVLGLEWGDIDFQRRTITWRAELDKTRRTWRSPLPTAAADVLRARQASGQGRYLFPSPGDMAQPVDRYCAAGWLRRAYCRAGIEKEVGGLWHPFRRKWATERKRYPVADVAAAGGWKDLTTLLTCYQQPDGETMRAVVELTPFGNNSHSNSHTSSITQTAPPEQSPGGAVS